MKEYIIQINSEEVEAAFDSYKATELVRCEDCKKHYNELICPCGGYTPCNGYCSAGIRKE